MTVIYLLRHGEPDMTMIRERNWPGAAGDLAPLSARGVQQALAAADSLSAAGPTAIVSSPMTRALQTASLVASRLGLQVDVHLDLREWLSDDTFSWRSHAEVKAAMDDLVRCGGAWPAGEQRHWEPLATVHARATPRCASRWQR
jgi:broad specificity phosphatase PhoE